MIAASLNRLPPAVWTNKEKGHSYVIRRECPFYTIASAYCLDVGGQSQIKPSATLEDATHLCMCQYRPVYLSSDEAVASVDENGRITARKAGTASITVAVTYGGKTLSAKIPVAVR